MINTSLPRVLLFTGIAIWIGVCMPAALAPTKPVPDWRLPLWAVASLLFLAAFWWSSRSRAYSLFSLACQSVGVIAMVALLCYGWEGLLLVIIAAQLALYHKGRVGIVWIGVQTLALAATVAVHWNPMASLLLAPPYLALQLLMFAAVKLFVDEQQAREALASANETLLRLQTELAQKARLEERWRIAQDLHDVLGHHLTALSLNLEVAAHEPAEASRATIRRAQSLARALLSTAKGLVRSASDDLPVDLRLELTRLAEDLPRPTLHIECSSELRIPDPTVSRALFRVAQEIVTNAIRHAQARNLWIALEHDGNTVTLFARDDGESALSIVEGFGLAGMRRRLEELGGTLSAGYGPGGGFIVRAELPCARSQAA